MAEPQNVADKRFLPSFSGVPILIRGIGARIAQSDGWRKRFPIAINYMTYFRDNGILPYSYDPGLVAISVLIAVLASYVALHFAARLATTRGRERFGLLLCGALAMGTGVWSMHFVAMLAFSLPIPMFYDVPTVVLSHLAAVAAAGVALHVVSREAMGLKSWLYGSVLMGSGIGVMHYTGSSPSG